MIIQMRLEHLSLLCSPKNQRPLELLNAEIENNRIRSGLLSDGENSWPIVNFIPRFVPEHEYWDSFSFQWSKHPLIMHELHSGLTQYRDRFSKETKWESDLRGELILEAGCGVGAFTKFALETGATVISFDVSNSVDVNYRVNGDNPNLLIVQASIYEMPFAPIFDKVFCFGVLQHTPDPKESLQSLINVLKPGGNIATDIYADVPLTRWHGILKTKYFLRKWTAGKNPIKLHALVSAYVNTFWPVFRLIQKLPYGVIISQHCLFDNYSVRMSGMKPEMYKEFAIVDIFDMLSPAYDYPQTIETFNQWHEEAGLSEIEVHYGYNGLEGRGRRP